MILSAAIRAFSDAIKATKDSDSVLTEGGAFNQQTGRPICMEPGCPREADCLPKLWVPNHWLTAHVKFDGVQSTMGLPYCFGHFHRLKPRDFLRSAEVRASIEQDFRIAGAKPDFDRAQLFQVRRRERDFRNWLILHKRHREAMAG